MSERATDGTERTYWLVYLWNYDSEDVRRYHWEVVGIVKDRQTWKDWWEQVMQGEIELPDYYDGWWVGDRPVSFGLYGTDSAQEVNE